MGTTDTLGGPLRLSHIRPRLPPPAHVIQQSFSGVSDPLGFPSGCSDSEARVSGSQPPLRVIFNVRETVVYARVPQGGEKQHLSSPRESWAVCNPAPVEL